jgi:hypothetical protein
MKWTTPLWATLLWALAFVLAPSLAWADDLSDLLTRLRSSGARVVEVQATDARLKEGKLTVGVGSDGKVEVYLPQGPGGVRTPLKSPTERMSVREFKALAGDMRRAVRETYGINVERVLIAGSSTGIPFQAPNGEVRTFDRAGFGTSDYDGALVSQELFAKVQAERPRAVRGANTGRRTAPDPLPELRTRFDAVSHSWGRHVAAMVYANAAEFKKRMELTGFTVGVNVMAEPTSTARYVETTRADLLGALLDAEQLTRLAGSGRGLPAAQELVAKAAAGEAAAQESVRRARLEAVATLKASLPLDAVDKATLVNEGLRLRPNSGFAGARPVAGPLTPWKGSEAALRRLFTDVRESTLARGKERLGDLTPSQRSTLEGRLRAAGEARLEILHSNGLLIEYVPERSSVRVSTGLLNRVAASGGKDARAQALRHKVLGLLFAHELAHASGIVAERVADAEAIKIVDRARRLTTIGGRHFPLEAKDVKATIGLFSRSGSAIKDALRTLKDLPRYGTPGGRRAAMLRTLRGEADPLARYRRADGTLEWNRLSRDKALQNSAGVAHFALALFLKELAVVVRTGDRMRIEEFFDGLATTDFFVTYGLFSVGAQAGNVAYSRFLSRYVKPRFVSNVLRTNVVLATGLLLPELVRGRLEGKAFLIDLGSLGLSATAVQTGVAGLKWVVNLRGASASARLARAGVGVRRLARLGGWFYTAAETAVVLYLGEHISQAIHHHLDERSARDAVRDAALAAREAALRPDVSATDLEPLLDALAAAHQDWRAFLLAPVSGAEALYHQRLERIARKAKLLADERSGALAGIAKRPALRQNLVQRHGSLEGWLAAQQREDSAEIEGKLKQAMTALERSRTLGLRRAYGEGQREDPYLSGVGLVNPSFWGRMRLRSELRHVSENRLQAYQDELTLLALLEGAASDGPKAAAIKKAATFTRRLRRADQELVLGKGAAGALTETREE